MSYELLSFACEACCLRSSLVLSANPCCCAVLFGDIGKKAAGARGRNLVYGIIYSLDATRCVILHLAATQSLQHALGASAPPMWQCGLAVMVMAGIATQVRSW
jgi:vesicular inhibitory amino acid transporter